MDSTANTVLVTGATGFVGKTLCQTLRERGWNVRAAVRSELPAGSLPVDEIVKVGEIHESTDFSIALRNVQAVIHLAARVHVMHDPSADPLASFRAINVGGTKRLAEMARDAGVKRFVFVSSIKVNGESTTGKPPYTEDSIPAPVDAYGISKLEAEQLLFAMHSESGMQVTVLRPPLVYGPGVKGNVLRLLKIAEKGVPLPLGLIKNRRSMVGVGNLSALLALCAEHPAASGQLFLAGDEPAIATPDLIRKLAGFMGRKARLIPFPVSMMRLAGKVLGKSDEVDRLTGSLIVDSGKSRRLLGFTPPYSMDEQLKQTVDAFLSKSGE